MPAVNSLRLHRSGRHFRSMVPGRRFFYSIVDHAVFRLSTKKRYHSRNLFRRLRHHSEQNNRMQITFNDLDTDVVDIILRMFYADSGAGTDGINTPPPITIGAVCSQWRNFVRARPMYWGFITLRLSVKNLRIMEELFADWIQCASTNISLDISISTTDVAVDLPSTFKSLILGTHRQWEKFSCDDVGSIWSSFFSTAQSSDPFPLLHTVSFDLYLHDHIDFRPAKNLRYVYISNSSITTPTFNWKHLRDLAWYQTTVKDVEVFLGELRDIYDMELVFDDNEQRKFGKAKSCILNHLGIFAVEGDSTNLQTVLNVITAPNITILCITLVPDGDSCWVNSLLDMKIRSSWFQSLTHCTFSDIDTSEHDVVEILRGLCSMRVLKFYRPQFLLSDYFVSSLDPSFAFGGRCLLPCLEDFECYRAIISFTPNALFATLVHRLALWENRAFAPNAQEYKITDVRPITLFRVSHDCKEWSPLNGYLSPSHTKEWDKKAQSLKNMGITIDMIFIDLPEDNGF
uniref:F-box domain-containing protein n=2 Tax=Psilocybe cubensis TaxID=181762 RepID=A0A8H7Y2A2_PSICU